METYDWEAEEEELALQRVRIRNELRTDELLIKEMRHQRLKRKAIEDAEGQRRVKTEPSLKQDPVNDEVIDLCSDSEQDSKQALEDDKSIPRPVTVKAEVVDLCDSDSDPDSDSHSHSKAFAIRRQLPLRIHPEMPSVSNTTNPFPSLRSQVRQPSRKIRIGFPMNGAHESHEGGHHSPVEDDIDPIQNRPSSSRHAKEQARIHHYAKTKLAKELIHVEHPKFPRATWGVQSDNRVTWPPKGSGNTDKTVKMFCLQGAVAAYDDPAFITLCQTITFGFYRLYVPDLKPWVVTKGENIWSKNDPIVIEDRKHLFRQCTYCEPNRGGNVGSEFMLHFMCPFHENKKEVYSPNAVITILLGAGLLTRDEWIAFMAAPMGASHRCHNATCIDIGCFLIETNVVNHLREANCNSSNVCICEEAGRPRCLLERRTQMPRMIESTSKFLLGIGYKEDAQGTIKTKFRGKSKVILRKNTTKHFGGLV